MKVLTAEQVRNVDAYTIAHEPIQSVDLMERAATGCYHWIWENLPSFHRIRIFVGPGNNGGDGLAIARLLSANTKNIEVIMLGAPEKLSADALANYQRLQDFKCVKITMAQEGYVPVLSPDDLVIDALFGSGLSRPISGLAAEMVHRINDSDATVIAIDIPSGLNFDENNDLTVPIIKADHTLTFQVPKLAFFFAENYQYTGEWHLIDIGLMKKAFDQQVSATFFLQRDDIRQRLIHRTRFSHKGTFGHALLMSGSYGKMGAAVLSSMACLRTGVGLLTTHIVSKGYDIIQTAVPEAIVSIDPCADYLSVTPDLSQFDAIGIGPGIGTNDYTGLMFHQLLKTIKVPLIIDADALNLLSLHPEWINDLPENTILTPHPGEFDRLTGKSLSGYERFQKQKQFATDHRVIVILKGAYTSIVSPEGVCWFNSTGNPGMATAGSGDVLTGIVLSLLARNYKPMDAALAAVYLHGLSGDLARETIGEEALIASDIINHLGKAFISFN